MLTHVILVLDQILYFLLARRSKHQKECSNATKGVKNQRIIKGTVFDNINPDLSPPFRTIVTTLLSLHKIKKNPTTKYKIKLLYK